MIVIHHNDADGLCAAAILEHKFGYKEPGLLKRTDTPKITYISITYGDSFNPSICEGEDVWIVDFTFENNVMKQINDLANSLVWIDHHISRIDDMSSNSLMNTPGSNDYIRGVRVDGIAACELTWFYVYHYMDDEETNLSAMETLNIPDLVTISTTVAKSSPDMVRLIGDNDVRSGKYGELTRLFLEAFLIEDETHPTAIYWRNYFVTHDEDQKQSIANEQLPEGASPERNLLGESLYRTAFTKGEILLKHSTILAKRNIDKYAYPITLGGYKGYACNNRGGSHAFNELYDQYDFVCSYVFTGDSFIVNLYSRNTNVVQFAKAYGGGGHKLACGFRVDKLPRWLRKPKQSVIKRVKNWFVAATREFVASVIITRSIIANHAEDPKLLDGGTLSEGCGTPNKVPFVDPK